MHGRLVVAAAGGPVLRPFGVRLAEHYVYRA
jgi:hypothetical protein